LCYKKDKSKYYSYFRELESHFFLDEAQLNNRGCAVLTVILDGSEVAIDGFFEIESAAVDLLFLVLVVSAID
jgi:hypothetical protein